MKGRLPLSLTVELLRHMSEEGRFDQTRSEFPDFQLEEIRKTFAWLAEQLEDECAQEKAGNKKLVREYARTPGLSPETRRVLQELPPEEGLELLRNFGAID